jgi:hypothetical protein
MPPYEFFTVIQSDPGAVASFAHHPRSSFLAGGLPVVVNGDGGVGVPGAMTGVEDRRIAEVAVNGVDA